MSEDKYLPRPGLFLTKELARWFAKWGKLTWRERGLLMEAVLLLGAARATVLFIPFKYIAPKLGKPQHETPLVAAAAIAPHVAQAINRVSRRTPWESNCFAQALAGHVMLRRRGTASTLYLGVNKVAGILTAHAWLRSGDLIVTGAPQHEQYTAVARYGWQRKRLSR